MTKNEPMMETIKELKKTSIEKDVKIWKRVASDLEKSTRNRRFVNIYKIEKYARAGEIIVVPGKVLGTGDLTKKVTIAAHTFSDSAFEKINNAKGEAISIMELVKKNPQGKKVRILG